jgi:GNAT superfamily N-acetyltransferase
MDFREAHSYIELYQAFNIINKLDETYPDFNHWYWNKVVPGVVLGTDKVILGTNKNEIVGISIIKDTITEKKLRALRIDDKYQKKGFGTGLIDKSLELLNEDKPLVSVSEDLLHLYSRIFINRYDFDMTYVHKGLYQKGKLEYQFNGVKNSLLTSSLPF